MPSQIAVNRIPCPRVASLRMELRFMLFFKFPRFGGSNRTDGKELKGEFGELDSGTYMNLLRAPGRGGHFTSRSSFIFLCKNERMS